MDLVAMKLVTKVVEKLGEQLIHEYETFKGFEDDVAELKSNLDLLKSFLKDADVKRHTNEMVQHCVEEIKEIVYDAEDVIETCILKENKENKSGITKRIIRFACTIVDRRKIVYDIKGISKRISKVIQDMQSFGVQQMITDAHPLQERQKEMRQQFAKSNESNLVCLEENVYKLVGYLTEEEEIQIISVTGMGGLGKTTLARQVFEHEDVRHKFKRFAWVCVSQEFTRISVWQTILQNLTSKERKDEIQKMNEVELQDELYQLFQTSKSLIVLDDIWRKEDWNRIKEIFPPTKGWKVLLTSRNEWSGMREDTKYTNLKPECLTFKDSWTLFERIVPRKDASEFNFDKEMEELGEQMVKHCGGLPLAIKVLGGLLAEKYTLHDWKRLAENIGSELMGGDDNSCNYILSLSYEELSGYLKHCFLYLAHFPEDYEIEVGRLSYYWAAEGISDPRSYDGECVRDIGDRYIEELVRRNMVIADRDEATLRYERCHMHDMMREVCLLKAKEENFLEFITCHPPTANIQSSIKSRRCVSHNPKKLHVKREVNNPKLRSLVLLQVKYYCKVSSSSYTELELLRVLDLSKTRFRRTRFGRRRLASGIGKLVHLRYLSLESARVSHIPCSLGNLKLLIYLNLDILGTVYVPNVLMGMLELRFLALPQSMHKKTRLELSNQVKLETLKYFSTKNSSLEDIRGMVKLKVLIIDIAQETSMETIYASIGGLRNLESLDIWFKRRIEDEIVFDFPHLKTLMMREIPRLPKEQNFPSCVTMVNLCSCRLEEDPMPILENLVLLKGLCLYFNSFIGKRMVCLGSGFPKLLKLEIYKLFKWEEWIIEEGSMPLLQSLSLKYCPELKEFPDGLRFITSIKELDTDQRWKERLSEGGQEYYKVKHIPRVNFSKLLKLQSEIRRNFMYM